MRQTCECKWDWNTDQPVDYNTEECGRPAVANASCCSIHTCWMCAEHWDAWIRDGGLIEVACSACKHQAATGCSYEKLCPECSEEL